MTDINVEITPEMQDIISSFIATGSYSNEEEFIREAILQFKENKETIYKLKIERLKEALAPGIKDVLEGNFSTMTREDFIARIESYE